MIKSLHCLTALSSESIIGVALPVTCLKTPNHLSSLHSSLKESISCFNASHLFVKMLFFFAKTPLGSDGAFGADKRDLKYSIRADNGSKRESSFIKATSARELNSLWVLLLKLDDAAGVIGLLREVGLELSFGNGNSPSLPVNPL